jgi:hypothetical protein
LLEFGGLELKELDGKLISMGWDGMGILFSKAIKKV